MRSKQCLKVIGKNMQALMKENLSKEEAIALRGQLCLEHPWVTTPLQKGATCKHCGGAFVKWPPSLQCKHLWVHACVNAYAHLCERVLPARPLQKGLSKKAFAKGSFQEGMQKGLAMKAFAKGSCHEDLCKRVFSKIAFAKVSYQQSLCKKANAFAARL